MTVKKGQAVELDVVDVAFGGKGLARADGMAVFVDGAVAGDRVLARIVKRKKQYAEARILQLLHPSADRVAAPCPYSGVCGGCKWQNLAYPRQLAYKRRHVAETLAHVGGLAQIPVHPAVAADPIFGYRNKMEFSCTDRRWLMPAEMDREDVAKGFALGLHVPGTFDKVLDIEACLLMPSSGNAILGRIREQIRLSGLPPYGLRSHRGFWRFVMLRHSPAEDRWLVNLVTAGENREALQPLAHRLMADFDRIAGVVNNVTDRPAAIAVGQFERPLAGSPVLKDRIGPWEFEVSANSFFQTNSRAAARLYETVQRYAGLDGTQAVLDLYSGTGTIPIFLSPAARQVVGIEIVAAAVADARRNCQRNGVGNCRFIEGDIRTVLAGLDLKPDVVIVDPPRAGMHADVVARLLELAPPRIVYVSCNPATLARDLGLLADAYRVAEVQPVAMFPHTFHIEAVARLERKI
ncbi:MAG: 23S rRNA (uracil(1939)-C(5))-methyltransferase RlmD [Deltaproteobacteria bacterium]|nr:23S rRNA (uracil(1939)-C(5))-methyltransferase RlmD [Deltaproteobacteria bacterium]